MKRNEDNFNAVFGTYTGKKRWIVEHPRHKTSCTVAAPDSDSAICAAADYWNERWTALEFYSNCTVRPA